MVVIKEMPKDYEYVKDENGELIYIRAVSENAIKVSMNEEEKLNALYASFEKLSTLKRELTIRKTHPELTRRGKMKSLRTKTLRYTIKHYDLLQTFHKAWIDDWFENWDKIRDSMPDEDLSYVEDSPDENY